MSAPIQAPASGVSVRMYRQGLGDCFLLTFRGTDGAPRFMLIDCGILKRSPGEEDRMKQVVANLAVDTGGHIHFLVVTHEHWDHLCGFLHAHAEFANITVGEVWFAWTEDPDHPLGQELRGSRAQALHRLQAALTRMHLAADPQAGERAAQIEAVLDFFGWTLGADGSFLGADSGSRSGPLLGASPTTAGALEKVAGMGRKHYRRPGEHLMLPEVAGVRVYVLGPPEDAQKIRKSDPTKKGKEVYEKGFELDQGMALYQAVAHLDAAEDDLEVEDREWRELAQPFERRYRIDPARAAADLWFREHYFGSVRPEERDQGLPSPADTHWRRVDADWMDVASELALQLDSDTNNTSLVLAIELVESGKVLLFPGDAQVGNWLSWHDLTWKLPQANGRNRLVKAEELLRRTVLYKVGHHASHNATLRAQGLELMEHPELVAMVPVDEEVAHLPKGRLKNGWDMPFGPLLTRLHEKTRGRVIRADRDVPAEKPETAQGLRPEEWDEFRQRVSDAPATFDDDTTPTPRRLYVEYRVNE